MRLPPLFSKLHTLPVTCSLPFHCVAVNWIVSLYNAHYLSIMYYVAVNWIVSLYNAHCLSIV